MVIPAPWRFYRIILGPEPTVRDFMSFAAQAPGRPVPADPAEKEMWEGVSLYDTLERARRMAIRKPHLGAYIAAVDLRPQSEPRCERRGARRGHHTVWGEPLALLACVVDVVPV